MDGSTEASTGAGTEAGTASLAAAILAEAEELIRISAQRALTVRLAGSLAIRAQCPAHAPLLAALGRRPYRDIDLMAYWKDRRQVAALFEERGYVLDPAVRHAQEFGVKRFVYEHPGSRLKADVFCDDLVMAHTIPFRGRLELDAPAITVTDLLLTKLQIHEFTENDLIDCVVLLAEHEPGDTIDTGYIADIMRKDWGFCHSTQLNLAAIGEAAGRFPALPADVATTVRRRAAALRHAIDSAPKTQKWKLRARLGDRVRWYEEVEEVNR
ncbi:MAG TPA: hypothetical protein VKV38_03760 [Trebonia sp.]|jgi:hypothetical protein|nr:hypothetical protein [Trebonia sp.]